MLMMRQRLNYHYPTSDHDDDCNLCKIYRGGDLKMVADGNGKFSATWEERDNIPNECNCKKGLRRHREWCRKRLEGHSQACTCHEPSYSIDLC